MDSQPRSVPPHARRPRRGLCGQSLVEFALTLPVFLLLVAGVFEGGWAAYTVATLAHAANEGGRVAALPDTSSTSQVVQAVQRASRGMVQAGAVTVTINGATAYSTQRRSGDKVRVTIAHTHRPFLASVLGRGAIPIERRTEFWVE